MKHIGDITKVDGAAIEPVDCITFGSPCQDLSNAGLRKGLEGERSGLFVEAVRVIKEMRDESERRLRMLGADFDRRLVKPRFGMWENVAGAFSSGTEKGADFRVVLELLARIVEPSICIPGCTKKGWAKSGCIVADDWSIAWRLFDSQYFGIPQRRERICVLCDFNGQSAGDILLTEHFKATDNTDGQLPYMGIRNGCGSEVRVECEGLPGNLESVAEAWKGIATDPKECVGTPYTLKLRHTGSDTRGGGVGALVQTNLSATLSCNQDQTLFQPTIPVIDIGEKQSCGVHIDKTPTLTTTHGGSPVAAVPIEAYAADIRNSKIDADVNGSLQSRASNNVQSNNVVLIGGGGTV